MTRSSMCPPGVFCLSSGIILCIILFMFIGAAIFLKPSSTIIMPPTTGTHATTITTALQDGRYSQAPQPLRDWMGRPEFPPRGGLTSMPINIPTSNHSQGGFVQVGSTMWNQSTQGLPESFQSVGIIKAGEQILPIYGRRTTGASDRWNYYTRTDTFNPVPLPIQSSRRNCMDDIGCPELMSGEHVNVSALGKEGQVEIYRFDGPKYIPGLL